jgi:hypothetical protein
MIAQVEERADLEGAISDLLAVVASSATLLRRRVDGDDDHADKHERRIRSSVGSIERLVRELTRA